MKHLDNTYRYVVSIKKSEVEVHLSKKYKHFRFIPLPIIEINLL